jgi:hypothetical protein
MAVATVRALTPREFPELATNSVGPYGSLEKAALPVPGTTVSMVGMVGPPTYVGRVKEKASSVLALHHGERTIDPSPLAPVEKVPRALTRTFFDGTACKSGIHASP